MSGGGRSTRAVVMLPTMHSYKLRRAGSVVNAEDAEEVYKSVMSRLPGLTAQFGYDLSKEVFGIDAEIVKDRVEEKIWLPWNPLGPPMSYYIKRKNEMKLHLADRCAEIVSKRAAAIAEQKETEVEYLHLSGDLAQTFILQAYLQAWEEKNQV